jgi:hypothetical protein
MDDDDPYDGLRRCCDELAATLPGDPGDRDGRDVEIARFLRLARHFLACPTNELGELVEARRLAAAE